MSSTDGIHPTKGPFLCRTDGCKRVFDDWSERNAHQSRCNYVCAQCSEHFQYRWLLDNHLHQHRTGWGFRCRLGCSEEDRQLELPGRRPSHREIPDNLDKKFLWFAKEHEMRNHHLIDHGLTWAQACRAQQVPASYDGAVPVPLVKGKAAQTALAIVRGDRRRHHVRTTINRGEEGKAKDLKARRLRRATERALESEQQRQARQARDREYLAKSIAKRRAATAGSSGSAKKKRKVMQGFEVEEDEDLCSDELETDEDELETDEDELETDEDELKTDEELERAERSMKTLEKNAVWTHDEVKMSGTVPPRSTRSAAWRSRAATKSIYASGDF